MKIPDMFYNQGSFNGKSNPYEDIYHRVETSGFAGWTKQNGQDVFVIEVGEHKWDCCCSGCIDDETVTEHLEWIDWYGRNYEWEVTHHRNWKYEWVDKLGTGNPMWFPKDFNFTKGDEEE